MAARCYAPRPAIQDGHGPPIKDGQGNLLFQGLFYHVGWIVCAVFAVIATLASAVLIVRHLGSYTNKQEQRHIVRLLFMVPIYAFVSTASFLFWNNATPLILIRDAYESVVLTSFFYLLLAYIAPTTAEQKEFFRTLPPLKKWMLPLGRVKWRPTDGLHFLQLMKWCVLQYTVVRPLSTLAAVILNALGYYCESSWSPKYGYVYNTVIISISVSVAMYALLQLYTPLSERLAPHRPLLKLFAVKAVVFLTFWQATLLGGLASIGLVKDTPYMTSADIQTGLAALLECVEMAMFAFLHFFAFSWKPYVTGPAIDSGDLETEAFPPPPKMSRWRALGHALDFRETWREITAGTRWGWIAARGRDPEKDVRRRTDFEALMGRERAFPMAPRLVPNDSEEKHHNDDPEDWVDVPPPRSLLRAYQRVLDGDSITEHPLLKAPKEPQHRMNRATDHRRSRKRPKDTDAEDKPPARRSRHHRNPADARRSSSSRPRPADDALRRQGRDHLTTDMERTHHKRDPDRSRRSRHSRLPADVDGQPSLPNELPPALRHEKRRISHTPIEAVRDTAMMPDTLLDRHVTSEIT